MKKAKGEFEEMRGTLLKATPNPRGWRRDENGQVNKS